MAVSAVLKYNFICSINIKHLSYVKFYFTFLKKCVYKHLAHFSCTFYKEKSPIVRVF